MGQESDIRQCSFDDNHRALQHRYRRRPVIGVVRQRRQQYRCSGHWGRDYEVTAVPKRKPSNTPHYKTFYGIVSPSGLQATLC